MVFLHKPFGMAETVVTLRRHSTQTSGASINQFSPTATRLSRICMTRKNNNTRNENATATVRNDFRLEPKVQNATDKAREAATREQEREARKAQREQAKADAKSFDTMTMTVNDALRNVAAHAKEEIREGFTVADYMASLKLTKLTIKALREALPAEFTREDGIYMPCTNAAVYDGGTPEDERNGKAVYYCVTKGKGDDAHKV